MDNPKKSSNRRDVKSNDKEAVNSHERRKDFLSESEMKIFLASAKKSCYPKRNYLLLLMMYHHGLRVSEAIQLKRACINIQESRIWVSRLKSGLSVEHPISGDELRAIKRYLAPRKDNLPWLFVNELGLPLTGQAVNYIVSTTAEKAKLENVHPRTLRPSCGFYLTNKGYDLRLIQDYLGHRDPQHTAHYTMVMSKRFENFW